MSTLYRVELRDDTQQRLGFAWFATKPEAEAADRDGTADTENIEAIEYERSVEGTLKLLNRYASRPDNGEGD